MVTTPVAYQPPYTSYFTPVYVTSTPAKASEQRSPNYQKDQPKPPTSVGVANQLIQSDGCAKAGLVVSTRGKEFKRTPQTAGHQPHT